MHLCRNIFAALILMLMPQMSAWAQDNGSPEPNANSAQNQSATGAADTDDTANEL